MSDPIPPGQLHLIHEALRRGHKIEAIKLYREATGQGLAESKDAVEAMVVGPAGSLPTAAGQSPGGRTPLPPFDPFEEKKKSGCLGAVALAAGAVTVLALLY